MPLDCLDINQLAHALAEVPTKKAVAINCLSPRECDIYLKLVEELKFQQAMPFTGSNKFPVYQDFKLIYSIPSCHAFRKLSQYLTDKVKPLLKKHINMSEHMNDLRVNDLIVQRYPPGCRGISSHRDHIKYRLVIMILLISGDGNFRISNDRNDSGGYTLNFNVGQLLIMGAPGISPQFKRPFHSVKNISLVRHTIGMRFDSKA